MFLYQSLSHVSPSNLRRRKKFGQVHEVSNLDTSQSLAYYGPALHYQQQALEAKGLTTTCNTSFDSKSTVSSDFTAFATQRCRPRSRASQKPPSRGSTLTRKYTHAARSNRPHALHPTKQTSRIKKTLLPLRSSCRSLTYPSRASQLEKDIIETAARSTRTTEQITYSSVVTRTRNRKHTFTPRPAVTKPRRNSQLRSRSVSRFKICKAAHIYTRYRKATRLLAPLFHFINAAIHSTVNERCLADTQIGFQLEMQRNVVELGVCGILKGYLGGGGSGSKSGTWRGGSGKVVMVMAGLDILAWGLELFA